MNANRLLKISLGASSALLFTLAASAQSTLNPGATAIERANDSTATTDQAESIGMRQTGEAPGNATTTVTVPAPSAMLDAKDELPAIQQASYEQRAGVATLAEARIHAARQTLDSLASNDPERQAALSNVRDCETRLEASLAAGREATAATWASARADIANNYTLFVSAVETAERADGTVTRTGQHE